MNSYYYRFYIYVHFFLAIIFGCVSNFAQAQCSPLSRPTVKYTFGNGTTQFSPLEADDFGFSTTYDFENGETEIFTNDGEFSFVNLVANPWNVWHDGITDHTGDEGGYMMLVNASYDAGEFYRDTLSGLCMGVQYEFSVWIGNADDLPSRIMPNVRFEIRDANTGGLLANYETGDLPIQPVFTWERHAVEFDATTDEVVLLLINNNPGGSGNDLVLDDVAFTPCLPVYDIAGDSILCIGENLDLQPNLLVSSYLTPEYQWQKKDATGNWVDLIIADNLLTPSITEVDSGWYQLLVAEMGSMITGMHCRSLDSIYIDVVEPLDPGNISASQTICFNTAPSLFTSLTDASSASETIAYQWEASTNLTSWNNANATTPTFQETALLTDHHYRRRATTDCYTEYSDTITVSVYDSLTNNTITSDQVVCEGATPALTTISSPIAGGKGTYAFQWYYSNDSLTWVDLNTETGNSYQSPTITEDTYIRLTAQDSCGNRTSNVVKLDYQLTASPTAIEDTICEASPQPTLSVSGINIQWYDPTNNPISPPTFTNNTVGTQRYFVTETLLGCESEKTLVSLTVLSKPTITLTPEAECEGDTAQFAPTVTGGTTALTYDWFTALGTPISSSETLAVRAETFTFFSLVVSDNYLCADSTSITLDVYSKPIVSLTDTSICAGDTITVSPTITNATGAIDYDWIASSISVETTPTLEFHELTSTNYTLLISDGNNCKDTSEVSISINERPIVALSGLALCEGEEVTLIPTITNFTSSGTHSWYNASNLLISNVDTINYTGLITTDFTLIFEDGNTCKDTAKATVVVAPKPVVTLTDETICEDEVITITPTITNATGAITYQWTQATSATSKTTPTIQHTGINSTSFELIVADDNTCKDTVVIQITVLKKPDITIQGSDVCSGTPSSLQATISNYTSGLAYNWSPSAGLSNTTSASVNAVPSTTTKYLLTVTTVDNCIDTLSHVVGVTNTPSASILGKDTILCAGQFVTYSAYDDPTENYSTEWYFSANDTTNFSPIQLNGDLNIQDQGYYRILVRNAGFCPVWSDIIYIKTEHIEVSLQASKTSIPTGESTTIEAITSPDVLHMIWSTGEIDRPTIVVAPTEKTTYDIQVRGELCTAYDEITIEVLPPILIPNGFSPNGDGKNDQWFIKGLSYYPDAEVTLFNRWGNIVYTYESGYNEPWDGLDLQGMELPVATYYYVIQVKDEKEQVFDGSVSIVR